MMLRSNLRRFHFAPAFSLVEVLAVVAVMVILLAVGVRLMGNTAGEARRTATDTLSGMIEQARTTAMTSRAPVVLAIAEPGDLPTDDPQCMIGLFQLSAWPDKKDTLDAVLLRRWQTLPTGVVLLNGGVNGLRNPRDEPETTLRYTVGSKIVSGQFHILAFNARGGLLAPAGADPVCLRVAEGTYRNRGPAANARNSSKPRENTLRVGRVIARPYRLDG